MASSSSSSNTPSLSLLKQGGKEERNSHATHKNDSLNLSIEKARQKLEWRRSEECDDLRTTNKENGFPVSSSSRARSSISPRKKRESPSKAKMKKKKSTTTSASSNNLKSGKSYGIPPSSFHRHKSPKNKSSTNNTKKTDDNAWLDEFHQQTEANLLQHSKEQYRSKLEQRRKQYKKQTCLKRWPIQQMAMDHLRYLESSPGDDGNSKSQYHGGEYMSGESSSSLSSKENDLAEQKSRRISDSSLSSSSAPSPTKTNATDTDMGNDDNGEPLWSYEPRIFATEKAQGKRKYLVGHFGRIADWYWRKNDHTSKHLYEVIKENTPCRLYFDLEYSKAYNENIDDEQLLEEFQIELAADLKTYYNLTFTKQQIIDLDSSTDAKFSKHWIFDFDSDGLFEDAPCVGRFVKRLVGRLAEELATGQLAKRRPELAKHLFVKTKDENKPSCFIDLGVYTKNRLFRVIASSKFGKTASLKPSQSNLYPNLDLPVLVANKNQEHIDEQQESSSPPSTPKTITTLEDYMKANDWRPHARALANTLVIPLRKATTKSTTVGSSNEQRILTVPEDETSYSGYRRSGGGKTTPKGGFIRRSDTSSFLPSLDKYVLEVLATRGGVHGIIRSVSIEYGPSSTQDSSGDENADPISITYQLFRNRYCELIGRSHKSNNIYWTISDLGTVWTCIQGCHDPECFGRGSPQSISPNSKHYLAIEKEWQQYKEEQFESALLALNLDDVSNDDNNNNNNKQKGDQANHFKQHQEQTTATSSASDSSFQEEEFENALLSLNLDDLVLTKKNVKNNSSNESSFQNTTKESKKQYDGKVPHDGGDGADRLNASSSSTLSDTALLEAALSNPELFP